MPGPIRRLCDLVSADVARKRELIHYATLAANGHNTQPWRFGIHEDAIIIYPDLRRCALVVTPMLGSCISLGCAPKVNYL